MSNTCDKCNVEIENTKSHCPLCGRCCNDKENNQNECYPKYTHIVDKRKAIFNTAMTCLAVGNVICFLVNILFTTNLMWYVHLLLGSIFAFFVLLLPFRKQYNLPTFKTVFYLAFTLYIIALELITNSFGWGITIVIPMFYLGMSVLNMSLILFKNYHKWEYILPIVELVVFSTIIFIVNLAIQANLWASFSAMASTIALFIFLLVIKKVHSKNELKKNFHI